MEAPLNPQLFGIAISYSVALCLIVSTSSNLLPFKVFLSLGNREKTQGDIFVVKAGCVTCSAKNYH
jgi:hypothetical protein